MTHSREAETGQEADFLAATVRLAPAYLLANPLAGREQQYAAPQVAWLQRIESGALQAQTERAARVTWCLNCDVEKRQHSVLQIRKPFPPRLSRYLHRFHSSNSRPANLFAGEAC